MASQPAALRQRLRSVIEPVVAAAELYLEDLSLTRAGRRYVVRVTLDGELPVGHDELSEASREISTALDEVDATLGLDSYTLEVSSPGIDRPLTLPRHWRRSVGRLVTVRVGPRTITGRVTAADDEAVTIEAERHPLGELGPGRVQVEFNRVEELDDADLVEIADDSEADDSETDDSEEEEEEA